MAESRGTKVIRNEAYGCSGIDDDSIRPELLRRVCPVCGMSWILWILWPDLESVMLLSRILSPLISTDKQWSCRPAVQARHKVRSKSGYGMRSWVAKRFQHLLSDSSSFLRLFLFLFFLLDFLDFVHGRDDHTPRFCSGFVFLSIFFIVLRNPGRQSWP